ncbi:hypothetical protein Syun_011164 [Stephania yunnanensis]|uniref:Uncharacterized protein n=1 Tax=Stephania yunnanensis TaxID=152371 RepID=A0AAP0JXR5_9MAGN
MENWRFESLSTMGPFERSDTFEWMEQRLRPHATGAPPMKATLAEAIAAFARMTMEDSRKILPAEHYPSWVVFSQREKLNWLNEHLSKIWPYVDEAVSELVRSSVEPVLEQYRPVILSSLKFKKFTLGTVAPQFTGVCIIEDGEPGVSMELDMQWDGNPSIILDINTRLGVALPIQVKNIGFTGVFRLIFKPLVDELPCFGAISYSLREKGTIRDAIEDSITWPVRKIVPILPGDYSDLELKPVGALEVKLVQAKELSNKDIIGKSDPFAILYVRPLRDRTKTSKTINNQLNPIWNEHFDFVVEDASTQNLTVKIFDDEGIQASELIGCAQMRIKDLEPGKVKDVWLKLVKDLEVQRDTKNRGQVHLELLYVPYGMESGFTNPFAPQFSMTALEKVLDVETEQPEAVEVEKAAAQKRKEVIVRGVLSVTVMSAEDLPAVDLMGKADPYVVLTMKKTEAKNKTRVVLSLFFFFFKEETNFPPPRLKPRPLTYIPNAKPMSYSLVGRSKLSNSLAVVNDSLNPTWNQTFDFVVEDGLHDMLCMEVYDHDTFGKDYMGRCILTLTRVILEGEYNDSYPLEEAKSGKLNLHLKWMPQPLYRDS